MNQAPPIRIRPGPWFLTILLLVLSLPLFAQQREISGIVTHLETGAPLAGISIVVSGTTIGTVTNDKGEFQLSIPEHARTLIFTFPGMKILEESIAARTIINVVMESDILGLDEEIITAFGRVRKKKILGYAIQDVSGEIISQSKESNVVNSLQGRFAGVQITNADGGVSSGSRIIIRGLSCLDVGADNQPLFIVDGIPVSNDYSQPDGYGGMDYGNAIMDLGIADIENISVLKGANAAALYGMRALNGVVLITTKSGRSAYREKVSVSYESSFLWDRPLVIPDYQDKYGQGGNMEFEYVDGAYGGVNDGADESWGPPLDGRLIPQWDSPYDPETGVRKATSWIPQPDNVRNFLETGHKYTHHLAFRGATDKAHFRLSYTKQDIKGIIPHTDLKKNTLNLKTGYAISPKLNASGSVIYINNRSDNISETGYTDDNPIYSVGQWFGRQVNVENLRKYADQIDPVTGYPMNWNHSYHDNPYWLLHNSTNSRNRDRVIGSLNLDYQITDWLSFNATAGNDWYIEDRKEKTAHLTVRDPKGAFRAGSYRNNMLIANGMLHFQKNIGFALDLSATFGGEINTFHHQHHATYINELIVPDLYAVSNAAEAAETGLLKMNTELQSVFGSVHIGYKNFIYIDVTGRNDWSSTLPVENNSWFYPSASAGFILTELLPFESKILPFVKLRASYAHAGGVPGAYQLEGIYERHIPFNGNPVASYSSTAPLSNLKPKHKRSIELGADMRFLENRIGMDLTWYRENTINQVMNIAVSGQTGFSNRIINAGELQNKGVEVILKAIPVKTDRFRWDILANWAMNENLVVELYEDLNFYEVYRGPWYAQVHARPGEEYGILWSYSIVRENQKKVYYDKDETELSHVIYSGRPVVHPDGEYIRSRERTNLGTVYPDWFGGISNTFSYKNITASFLVDFRKGGVIFSVTDFFGHYTGVLKNTAAMNDRGRNVRLPVEEWGGIKVNGVYGLLDVNWDVQLLDEDGNFVSEPVVNKTYVEAQNFYKDYWGKTELSTFDASYIKLRELTLGYTFTGGAVLEKAGINSIYLSLLGRNLWIIHKNTPDIDPEAGMGAGNYVGFESTVIPSVRSMGFSLKATF